MAQAGDGLVQETTFGLNCPDLQPASVMHGRVAAPRVARRVRRLHRDMCSTGPRYFLLCRSLIDPWVRHPPCCRAVT